MYYSLMFPYLSYGVTVWGASNVSGINKVMSVHNRCIKLISPIHDPSVNMLFKSLNLLNFKFIHLYFILLKYFQYKHFPLYEYFNGKLALLEINHSYTTRLNVSHGTLLPRTTRARCGQSFLFQATKACNSLPVHLRQPMSYTIKCKLKKFLISSQ